MSARKQISRVYVPCAVSSFFEICDLNPDGSKIEDELRIGARGGGFVISRGNTTTASRERAHDVILINGKKTDQAKTSLKVLELLRKDYSIPPIKISHQIEPPIGSGFGTSGSGAIGVAAAVSDLVGLSMTLREIGDYAHRAEIQSTTGLGTVISLVSGSGAIGLVTEPGSFSFGRVDSILNNYKDYTLICVCYGPIEKSTVLSKEERRKKVNKFGNEALRSILAEKTPESLLSHSRIFAEKTGIASPELLKLADQARKFGAVGATQNMIGNAVHCLVKKKDRARFLASLSKIVGKKYIFESSLYQGGPEIL